MKENEKRFDWLQKEFLKYFIDWKQRKAERPGTFTQNAHVKISRQMFISWQIFEGLCITAYSIVALVKELLSRGAEYVFLQPGSSCGVFWRSKGTCSK